MMSITISSAKVCSDIIISQLYYYYHTSYYHYDEKSWWDKLFSDPYSRIFRPLSIFKSTVRQKSTQGHFVSVKEPMWHKINTDFGLKDILDMESGRKHSGFFLRGSEKTWIWVGKKWDPAMAPTNSTCTLLIVYIFSFFPT